MTSSSPSPSRSQAVTPKVRRKDWLVSGLPSCVGSPSVAATSVKVPSPLPWNTTGRVPKVAGQ